MGYGQKAEAEGYGARGPYGGGVGADVEGGRYGDRTVVAGRAYGGPVHAAQLPYGARPYNYHGRSYDHYGGAYYHPYHYHGAPYYHYMWPPWGCSYYLTHLDPGGEELYVVVDPPAGAVPAIPGEPGAEPQAAAAAAPATAPTPQPKAVTLTAQPGTPLTVRVATEVSSGHRAGGPALPGQPRQRSRRGRTCGGHPGHAGLLDAHADLLPNAATRRDEGGPPAEARMPRSRA